MNRHFAPDHTPNWKVLVKVWPIAILGLGVLVVGVWLEETTEARWWIKAIEEVGIVLLVVAVVHALYEIVIHRMLHRDITQLGVSVEALQRTVHIVGGAVESGLSAVYSSRDEVNRELTAQMERMSPGATLRLLGISLGAFLCPHGALHGAFRKLLRRKDVTIEALIVDMKSKAAIDRARLEEPQMFWGASDSQRMYEHTRCHNELKTATDFAQTLAEHCYYRDKPNGASPRPAWAPIEPAINAGFSFRIYEAPPLCYLVIFEDSMFLESYHDAGRGGEAPVLEIAKHSGESRDPTSLFRIYEEHYKVVKALSANYETSSG